MKKLLSIILCFFTLLLLTSCTILHTEAGTFDEFTGIYELTSYTNKDENNETIDEKANKGVKAFMLVSSTGFGYYYYKDNTTEYVTTIKFEFIPDIEDNSKYYEIRYDEGDITKGKDHDGKIWACDQMPGGGSEGTMGINVKKHTISYQKTRQEASQGIVGQDPISVTYTRRNTKVEFSDFKSTCGFSFDEPIEFGLKNLALKQYIQESLLIDTDYKGISFVFRKDFSQVDVYFSLKTDGENEYSVTRDVTVNKGHNEAPDGSVNSMLFFDVNGFNFKFASFLNGSTPMRFLVQPWINGQQEGYNTDYYHEYNVFDPIVIG